MFTLGYSFEPWVGDKAIADGPSILEYIRTTARTHGIEDKIRFHRRAVAASWSTAEARWTVEVERTDTGEREEITCGFLWGNTGYYRYDQGYRPDFPGEERFGGTIVHPQHWPEDLEWAGRRIVVIGSGATAVTLVPALAERGRPRHHAAALADLHRGPPGRGPDGRLAAAPPAGQGRPTPSSGGRTCCSPSSASRSADGPPTSSRRGSARGSPKPCPTATTSTPTSPPATTRGTSGSAWCPTATCSTPSPPGGPTW